MAECVLPELLPRRLEHLRRCRDQCRLVKGCNTVMGLCEVRHSLRVELGEVRKLVHQVTLTGASVEIHLERVRIHRLVRE